MTDVRELVGREALKSYLSRSRLFQPIPQAIAICAAVPDE
jgi:hypothetical protein